MLSFVVVGEELASLRGTLPFSSWMFVLARLVCWRCLRLSAGAGRAQLGDTEQTLAWVADTECCVPSTLWAQKYNCQTSGDIVPANIPPRTIFFFNLWLVLIMAIVELQVERKKKRLDFCSSHLPHQTHIYYLVMSLRVGRTLLGWMLGVRSAGHRKFLINVWSSSVKIHYIDCKFFEKECVLKALVWVLLNPK